jgi:hypothetical protein
MTVYPFSPVAVSRRSRHGDAGEDAAPVASSPAPTRYTCQTTHDRDTETTTVGASEGIYTRHEPGLWMFAPWANLDATMPVVTIETLYWLEMEHVAAVAVAAHLPRHLRVVV